MSDRAPGRSGPRSRGIARLAVIVALSACAEHAPERATPPHVLLISIDTLRADHLGCYGYPRDTSPNIDRLASESLLYERAYAPAPWTMPSHAAMLSGRHPFDLGIRHLATRLPEHAPLLAEALQAAGYATAAFVDSSAQGFVGGERGFARGFDAYHHAPLRPDAEREYDIRLSVDAALAWLDGRPAGRPFFLFLHSKSVHTAPVAAERVPGASDAPYDSPVEFRDRYLPGGSRQFSWTDEEDNRGARYLLALNNRLASGRTNKSQVETARIQELQDLYDGGIRYVDHELGRLRQGLADRGLAGETVILLTADHGEAFLEHDLFLHAEVHRQLLHVPLLLFDPAGPSPRRLRSAVSLEDVAPTLLRSAGLPISPGMTGRPLPFEDAPPAEPRSFFSYYLFKENHVQQAYSLQRDRYRLVYRKRRSDPDYRVELFDVEADPEEQRPLGDHEEVRRELLRELLHRLEDPARAPRQGEMELDAAALAELRALGYVE